MKRGDLAPLILNLRRQEHLSMSEISRKLKCSKARVSQVLADNGIGGAIRVRAKKAAEPAPPRISLRRFSWDAAE